MKKTLFLVALLCGCLKTTDVQEANKAAQEFITHIPNATGVECAQNDSDHDGYVTCTVFRGNDEPMSIQCGSETYCVNCARGCKYIPVLKLNKVQQ